MRALMSARWTGTIGSIVAMGSVLVTLGCKDLNVPNYTAADIDLLNTSPNASVINLMSTGLLRGIRSGHEGLETYGRDAYNLDPTEVRSVTVPLIGPLASGGYWSYGDIRNCYSILAALDKVGTVPPASVGLTVAQKEGVRGYVKTIMAYHFHAILRVRYQHGAFIDVNRPLDGTLAPHVNGKAVLDHIIALLDSAQTHLNAAGTAFSFPFTRGFQTAEGGAAFNTPATFLAFNRALKARVEVYGATWDTPNATAHWNAALAAITAATTPFAIPATPAPGPSPAVTLVTLNIGPKHTYGPTTADGLNGLFDNTGRQRYAHPSLINDAQLNGAVRDNRAVRKTILMLNAAGQPDCKGILGLCSTYRWNIPTNTTPIPIVRTEELILLRAEANLGLGNTSLAIRDINLIRVNSGQLTQISDPYVPAGGQPATLLDELLYEKRYSLVYEFGHRWVDLARYGKLLTLPRDQATHRIWPALPFDETECNFRRAANLSGCPVGGEGGI